MNRVRHADLIKLSTGRRSWGLLHSAATPDHAGSLKALSRRQTWALTPHSEPTMRWPSA